MYIREAHPTDSARPARHVQVEQPKTFLARMEVATACSAGLHLTIPLLVDDIDNTVMRAFDAFPDRLYIISPDGRIVFQGGRGPRGFSVPEMETALKKLLAAKSTPAKD